MSNKKSKKVYLELDQKIEFDCVNKEREMDCYSNGIPCYKSPCPLNMFDFGLHERIIEDYLKKEDFTNAYYYFQNLMPLFSFDCDINKLEEYKQNRLENPPVGCKLFMENAELRSLKNKLETLENPDSERGKKERTKHRVQFRKTLMDNFERLKHLAISKREERRQDVLKMKYNIAITSAQIGDLKAEAVKLPIHKDVKDAMEKPEKTEPKGF